MEQNTKMQTETSLTQKAIDIAIRLVVLAVLLAWCFQILRPFISPVIWGAIIAVTLLPVFEKINTRLGDRRKLTAAIITLGSLMVIILPSIQLTVSSVDSLYALSEKLQGEDLRLPPPPEGVGDWPVIGESCRKTVAKRHAKSRIHAGEVPAPDRRICQMAAAKLFSVLPPAFSCLPFQSSLPGFSWLRQKAVA